MLLGAPADSLNSLVVNAVDMNGMPASYTRIGPVLSFFYKPDVCYYGGDGCQALVERGTEIPVIAHATKAVAEKAPTHEEDGNVAHYLCGSCGKFFAEEAATTELTAEQVIVSALGHEYGEFQKDASKHWKECACGAKSEEAAHTFGDWTTTKAPAVGVEGSQERSCTACGYKETVKIPATTNPATGDSTRILLWTVLLLISACGLLTVFVIVPAKKRQR